jgi:protein TonB
MQRVPFVPISEPAGTSPRRWAAIGFVGVVHLALLYGLASGLAIRFVEQIPAAIQADVVKPQQLARPELPPPPAPELVAPQSVPQIPVPNIVIAHASPAPHAITAVAVEKPASVPAPRSTPPAAPVEAAPAIAPTPARSIAGTHTTPPYPPLAIRLGEEGMVRLHIALDSGGKIHTVNVVKTSGSERLDSAAVSWVAKHWRYAPATRDGKPVASSVLADVRFDLRNAR